ncbi:MAG: NAD(P)/FAD-dependent oxidoreductase, partial [Eubacteriales bacterium]|nr:NAD(P)/FAD-dependent oxidoreductase [Eubacteriales bacterium]
MTTAIIGGGAAGIAAAIAAAERGQRTLVLERNSKPLKKLGVTGNGRGNLLNAGAPVYFGDERFAQAVLVRMGYTELTAFFASVGVPLRVEEEGRVYPAALMASVVVDALLLRASQLGVEIMTGTRVTQIKRDGDHFLLTAEQTFAAPEPQRKGRRDAAAAVLPPVSIQTLRADRVIVTVGGTAAPAHGTDGSAYGLLTAFGHKLTPLRPAMCALLTNRRRIAGLAGQRVRAKLTLLSPSGDVLRQTQGELLFGEDALSGIAAMQLARFTAPGASVALDLRPGMGMSDADTDNAVLGQLHALTRLRNDCTVGDLLTGVFTVPIAKFLLREAQLSAFAAPAAQLGADALQRLTDTITN